MTDHYAAYSWSSTVLIKKESSNIQHHSDSIHILNCANPSSLQISLRHCLGIFWANIKIYHLQIGRSLNQCLMMNFINGFFTFLERYFSNVNYLPTRWYLDWERKRCGTLVKLAFEVKCQLSTSAMVSWLREKTLLHTS